MDIGNCLVGLDETVPDLTTETKVVNGILIVAGVLSAAAASWWVDHLRLVIRHLSRHRILYALVRRQLREVSSKTHGLISDALGEHDEGDSLLENESSESVPESV